MTLLKICAVLMVLSVVLPPSNGSTICGPALDDAIKTICVHGYNSMFKKSMKWDDMGNNAVEDELPFPYANFPFLAKVHGGQVNTLAKTRRYRDTIISGVYDECCNNGCTYNEIRTYCKWLADN